MRRIANSNSNSQNGSFDSGHHQKNGNRTLPGFLPIDGSKLRKIAECALGISIPLWLTVSFQADEPSCRVSRLIASTTAIYGILYAFLRHYPTVFQPPLSMWQAGTDSTSTENGTSKNGQSSGADRNKAVLAAAEWRSRILSILNAMILIVGSGLCFTEWGSTYDPESEGWVKTLPLQCSSGSSNNESADCSCFSSHPITFASLFVGYLQWDLCWLIWHRGTHPDVGSMIHHSIFIAVTQFVLSGTYFRKPFAWLSLTELSTPFLHLRWLLAATGNKTNRWYVRVCLWFALTFLTTRTIGYGLGLVDVWLSRSSWGNVYGLWGVVAGLHLAYLLNLFWSVKVGSALMRTVGKEKAGQKRE